MNNTIPGAGIDITVVFLVCVIALVVLTSAILISRDTASVRPTRSS